MLGAPLEAGSTKDGWKVFEAMPDGGRVPRQAPPAPHRRTRYKNVGAGSLPPGLGEGTQGFFEALLLGAVLGPVAAAQRLLRAVIDLQRALRRGADGRWDPTRRAGGRGESG